MNSSYNRSGIFFFEGGGVAFFLVFFSRGGGSACWGGEEKLQSALQVSAADLTHIIEACEFFLQQVWHVFLFFGGGDGAEDSYRTITF